MKKIVFFNYAHKGDIFLSRPFIDQIMNSIDAEFYYAHYWGEYLLKDLNLKYLSLDEIPKTRNDNEHADNFVYDGIIYINTWIGKYSSVVTPGYCECNLKTLHSLVYPEILEFISKELNFNLPLKAIEEYLACDIDYSHFNISSIDEFLGIEKRPKILFCNGPALSKQCEYNGDLSETIEKLCKKYSNIFYISTHKLDINLDNYKCTSEIINSEGQDLNEISYLSTFCDIIIGRYSGPFIFSNAIKANILNEKKSFLCFGEIETDCHPYGIDFDSEFIYEKFSGIENLEETIIELVEKINY